MSHEVGPDWLPDTGLPGQADEHCVRPIIGQSSGQKTIGGPRIHPYEGP